jgi:transposase
MFSSNAKEYRRHLALKLRYEEGKTQTEVARLVGVSQSSVSNWCKRVADEGEEGLKTKPSIGRKPRANSSLKCNATPPFLALEIQPMVA